LVEVLGRTARLRIVVTEQQMIGDAVGIYIFKRRRIGYIPPAAAFETF
jgi:hypothetical protein